MTTESRIKQEKKQQMTEDIKALFDTLDDVRLYTMRPAIEKIVRLHFPRTREIFIYYVGVYALALYDVYKMELKQEKDARLLKVLKNTEKDIDKFISEYKLSQFDLTQSTDLPF